MVVGSEEEWERVWPALQKDLAVFPVLGLDCEWVKKHGLRNRFAFTSACVVVVVVAGLPQPPPPPVQVSVKGRTSMVSLLQMASYSGRCVLGPHVQRLV